MRTFEIAKQIVADPFPIRRVFGISVLATRMQSPDLQLQLYNGMSDYMIVSVDLSD